MNRDYVVHWIIGLLATATWFWGEKAGIPAGGIQLAASIVPGILAHALNYSPNQQAAPAPASSPASTQQ